MRTRTITVVLLFLVLAGTAILQSCSRRVRTFSDLLERIQGLSRQQAEQQIRDFSQRNDFPFIEKNQAYFLFEDTTGKPVYLTGDFTQWKPDSILLDRIGKTPYYFKCLTFPLDARLEYKFVVGKQWLLDPLNPLKAQGGFGENSVLMMPQYVFPKAALLNLQYRVSRLDTFEFKSKILKNKRQVILYRHPQATIQAPLLIFNDGGDYLRFAAARIILDNLIGNKTIAPLNALFINPVQRQKEYWLNERYLRMVFMELLPFIQKKYGIQPDTLGFGGASLGGEEALYALKDYGKKLNFVFSQSGALWIEKGKLLKIFQKLSKIKARIYLSYGLFENAETEHKQLQTILEKRKVQYRMCRFPEGHNWGNWRGHLEDVLKFFRGH